MNRCILIYFLNPVHGEVYSIQHYVIKFVSDLWQFSGFLLVHRFPPPIKLTAKLLLKVALNTINHNLIYFSLIFMNYSLIWITWIVVKKNTISLSFYRRLEWYSVWFVLIVWYFFHFLNSRKFCKKKTLF